MNNQPDDNEQSRLTERFVRWQDNLRQSLGSHITLIVSWSAGGLAFCGVLLNSDKAQFGGTTTFVFLTTGALFILSLALSLFISWNRLQDTRDTLKILKARKEKGSEQTIKELQAVTNKLGNNTWCAVNFQLVVFALASIFLVVTVLLAFKDRLDACLSQ
ncbi:MAG TPA: hypothetical protein VHY30_04210 [Verrucomicrobiae bacterium]|jgi:hypothetical protein|nr:hypothetical protein [Verrucomicrobiae bacterium]